MLCVALPSGLAAATADNELIFYGLADASAAVFLDAQYFAAADDESAALNIYKVGQEKPAILVQLGYLTVDTKSPEADIEGAARVGDRIYWITSHGRNKDGKPRPNRYAFFATRIEGAKAAGSGAVPALESDGKPCRTLAEQLIAFDSLVQETLADATQFGADLGKKDLEKLAPKEKGLNIEGLCPYPANKSLLIGLRNPLYKGKGETGTKAIVIELLNPADIVDKGTSAKFGRVLLWDLGERGIRGMEYVEKQGQFFIIAGPTDSETTCAMYTWDGNFETTPTRVYEWPDEDDFTPEGIAQAADGRLWIFSDDGTVEVKVDSPAECLEGELLPNGKCPNKFLVEQNRKTFRVRVFDFAANSMSR